jgi:hypothetical protein
MPDTISALANDQDSPSLSQFERVVDTFIEPSKTFHDIKRNRSWWLPFVIIAVLGYIFCFVAVQHVGWNSLVTNAIKSNPRAAAKMETQTPADQAQTFAVTKGFIEGFMAGGPVVLLVISEDELRRQLQLARIVREDQLRLVELAIPWVDEVQRSRIAKRIDLAQVTGDVL